MDARDVIKIGMSAERTLVVPPEQTVGHLLAGMPMVFATPMMILQMELTSGDAIRSSLQPGWVTVRPLRGRLAEARQSQPPPVSGGRYLRLQGHALGDGGHGKKPRTGSATGVHPRKSQAGARHRVRMGRRLGHELAFAHGIDLGRGRGIAL